MVQVLSDCYRRAGDALISAALPAWFINAVCSCGSACADDAERTLTVFTAVSISAQQQLPAMISQPPALVPVREHDQSTCQWHVLASRHEYSEKLGPLGEDMCQQSLTVLTAT